jgi:chromosome segregation ATPase
MKFIHIGLITIHLVALTGCALQNMRSENTIRQASISEKEQRVFNLNVENQSLTQQTQILQAQLQVVETEFNTLSADFETLQYQIANLKATTSTQKQKLRRINNEMAKLKKRMSDVHKAPQGTVNELNSKQKEIQKLQDEIHTRLKMGLN